MDFTTLAFSMGSAWLSGVNLYATVLTLGLLQRFNLVHLPGSLTHLSSWWVIGVAGGMYAVQFIADKIPAVDSVWDAVHTFIRIPAGAILAASAFANFDPSVRVIALLAGGTLALTSHGAKAATRLAANTSPEPFSNILLSLGEDAVAIGGTFLMSLHPWSIFALIAIGLLLSFLLFRLILKAFRKLFGKREPSPTSLVSGN
jgi:uncharacterized membrane protein